MDPTTWPMWLKLLAGWGPLGLWAGTAEWRARKAESAHHETQDARALAAATVSEQTIEENRTRDEAHAAEIRALVDAHSKAMLAQAEAHAAEMRAQGEDHHKQIQSVTDRMVTLVEKQSAQAAKLVEKIEILRTRGGGIEP